MPDDEGLREELTRALLSADYESIDFGEWRHLVGDEERDQYDAYLAAVLPVVERHAARRAAEALAAVERVRALVTDLLSPTFFETHYRDGVRDTAKQVRRALDGPT